MTAITDEYMKEKMTETKPFTIVILKKGPKYKMPEVFPTIWEHARKNFQLKVDGLLPVVCPINDGTEVSGVGIFTADEEETKKLMEEDPAIKAEILQYEIHPTKSFPGSTLP
jgi:hypothetical protein